MPLVKEQHVWLKGIIQGLVALSDNRWMMPSLHLATILEELGDVVQREIVGHVVEMGCAGGRTSMKIAAFLQLLGEGPGRQLHLYDSFEGFPRLTKEDYIKDRHEERPESFRYPEKGISELFKEWGDGLLTPIIHKGFFKHLNNGSHPNPIAFAFIDCDVYESIKDSLHIVWPRLAVGGNLLVGDYSNPTWPGCKLAVDNFFKNIPSGEITRFITRHDTLLTITKR